MPVGSTSWLGPTISSISSRKAAMKIPNRQWIGFVATISTRQQPQPNRALAKGLIYAKSRSFRDLHRSTGKGSAILRGRFRLEIQKVRRSDRVLADNDRQRKRPGD